ncbi:uncharacterized protein RVIR1_08730 [Candidatus Rickettsiella viridis]|uniref:Uncharacterized protein n=1 Tax=Candidatus Rickettsiella viridis TaxID=676208 RepID=A0A2Z5UUN0_9COXI|nr:hypothetical protein [Candidatus Rickettsiella viridis]BBB15356.1 uncharacterized protein RVIR1_08730 [Candidatus Rickettsiella viridis]
MWNITTLSEKTQIPTEKLEILRTLTECLSYIELQYKHLPISDAQLKDIQTLLAECLGDMDMNTKIDSLTNQSPNDTGISSNTIAFIKTFTYRTRHLSKIANDLDTIFERFQQAKSGKLLKAHEKITLEQYGILYDLAHLNPYVKLMDAVKLIFDNETLEQLLCITNNAQTIIGHLDDTFAQSFKMPIGSVVFNNTSARALIHQTHLNFFDKLTAFVTKFDHVSKGILSSEGINKISHIIPTYKEEELTLHEYLYSDIYKIKLEKMIAPSSQKILKEKLGDNWLKQLEDAYSIIEGKLHDKASAQYLHFTANMNNRKAIEIATTWLQGGHKNLFFRDHSNEDFRDHFFNHFFSDSSNKPETRILCSQFVGISLIAAVQELNLQINEALTKKGVTELPKNIIKSPISKREKLYLLTPERLLDAMKKRGVLEKVPMPAEVSKFIAKNVI